MSVTNGYLNNIWVFINDIWVFQKLKICILLRCTFVNLLCNYFCRFISKRRYWKRLPPIKVTDQHMCIYTNKLKKLPETSLFWCAVNVEFRLNHFEKRWVKAKIGSVSWWGGFHKAARFTTPPDFAAKITSPLLLRPKLTAITPFV